MCSSVEAARAVARVAACVAARAAAACGRARGSHHWLSSWLHGMRRSGIVASRSSSSSLFSTLAALASPSPHAIVPAEDVPDELYTTLTRDWPNVCIRVDAGDGKGRGLFATRDLPAHTLLFEEMPALCVAVPPRTSTARSDASSRHATRPGRPRLLLHSRQRSPASLSSADSSPHASRVGDVLRWRASGALLLHPLSSHVGTRCAHCMAPLSLPVVSADPSLAALGHGAASNDAASVSAASASASASAATVRGRDRRRTGSSQRGHERRVYPLFQSPALSRLVVDALDKDEFPYAPGVSTRVVPLDSGADDRDHHHHHHAPVAALSFCSDACLQHAEQQYLPLEREWLDLVRRASSSAAVTSSSASSSTWLTELLELGARVDALPSHFGGLRYVLLRVFLRLLHEADADSSLSMREHASSSSPLHRVVPLMPDAPLWRSLSHLSYHSHMDDTTVLREYIQCTLRPLLEGRYAVFARSSSSLTTTLSHPSYWLGERGFARLLSILGTNMFHTPVHDARAILHPIADEHAAADNAATASQQNRPFDVELDWLTTGSASSGEYRSVVQCASLFALASYMNHACPDAFNVCADVPCGHAAVRFVTRHAVRAGDELTWCYGGDAATVRRAYLSECTCASCVGRARARTVLPRVTVERVERVV